MKWVLSHATDSLHQWLLHNEDRSRSLIINLQRLSFRLIGCSKRLFSLQLKGLFQKKILLRNEYGIIIGETAFASKPSPGHLLLNGQKFYHCIHNNELLLLNHQRQLLGKSEMAPEAGLRKFEFYSLLFGFAWFLTTDAVAEKESGLSITA